MSKTKQDAVGSGGGWPRVLIVDDQPESVALMEMVLRQHHPDGTFFTATSGAEGLQIANGVELDVVLLDAKMPGLEGMEVCRQLKANPRTSHVPVLLVSGVYTQSGDRVRGIEQGADGYLCKPFEPAELAAQVDVLLRIKRAEDALRSQLVRQEDELEASEERVRDLFDRSPDPLFVENEAGVVLAVNDAACRLHGFSRAELVGRSVLDLVPEEQRDFVRNEYPKWFTGALNAVTGVAVTKDGRNLPVDIRASRIEYGGQAAVLLQVRDISDRVAAESRQNTLLRGMRAIVGIADELIAAPDEDALMKLAVECARSRLGLERASILLNKTPWVQGTYGTDYQGNTTDERDKRMPMDEAWADILRLRSPDEPRWKVSESAHVYWTGERMVGDRAGWVALTPIQTAHKPIGVFCNDTAITGAPMDPPKQEVLAVYCSLLANIAERKAVEAERGRLALAVDQSAESVVITDTKGIISYVNPGFERMTGYRREEVIGKTPRILKSGRHGDQFYTRIWETLSRGRVWTGRMTNRRRDGSTYEIEHTISPVRDARGQIISYMSVAQDVTTAVQMENELRQAQKMESIGRLAGGIAHDFNNLLTAILGFSRMVASEIGPSSAARGDVDEIISAAERAAKLTRQLLSFGRKQVIQVQPVDLNALVGNLDRILRRTLGEHIELVTDLDPRTGLIEADPGQVEQVIMNLAINAHDAMPKGGRLHIATSRTTLGEEFCRQHLNMRPGDYAMLVVRDNGSGMPEHVRERAFEPFFTTKEKGKGSGLGLSTVYGIIKQSRGHIELASEPGVGTVLTIHFPTSTGEPLPRPMEDVSEVPTGSETILVAEDEPIVRRLTVRNLQSLGYQVMEAHNGEDALGLLTEHAGRIDLLLTDVVMPRLSGPDLVASILKSQPLLRHLFMSGFTEDMVTRNIHNAGAASLILKPFTRETLARQVRQALDKPQSETGR